MLQYETPIVVILIVSCLVLTGCIDLCDNEHNKSSSPAPQAPSTVPDQSISQIIWTTYIYANDDLIAKSITEGNDSYIVYMMR